MSPLPSGMTPSQVGERAEAAVLAALVATRKEVLVPFGQCRYDLAYEDEGRLIKVQCKTGRLQDGTIDFRTQSVVHGTVRDYGTDVDLFAVYCHELGTVYLVPVADVPSRSRASLRVSPPRNGQQSKIRWAFPYLLTEGAAPPGLLSAGEEPI